MYGITGDILSAPDVRAKITLQGVDMLAAFMQVDAKYGRDPSDPASQGFLAQVLQQQLQAGFYRGPLQLVDMMPDSALQGSYAINPVTGKVDLRIIDPVLKVSRHFEVEYYCAGATSAATAITSTRTQLNDGVPTDRKETITWSAILPGLVTVTRRDGLSTVTMFYLQSQQHFRRFKLDNARADEPAGEYKCRTMFTNLPYEFDPKTYFFQEA